MTKGNRYKNTFKATDFTESSNNIMKQYNSYRNVIYLSVFRVGQMSRLQYFKHYKYNTFQTD